MASSPIASPISAANPSVAKFAIAESSVNSRAASCNNRNGQMSSVRPSAITAGSAISSVNTEVITRITVVTLIPPTSTLTDVSRYKEPPNLTLMTWKTRLTDAASTRSHPTSTTHRGLRKQAGMSRPPIAGSCRAGQNRFVPTAVAHVLGRGAVGSPAAGPLNEPQPDLPAMIAESPGDAVRRDRTRRGEVLVRTERSYGSHEARADQNEDHYEIHDFGGGSVEIVVGFGDEFADLVEHEAETDAAKHDGQCPRTATVRKPAKQQGKHHQGAAVQGVGDVQIAATDLRITG
jgi:hypothetical protein